ncbi:MAG: response regulator [Candidatus Wallbacteria bacterium]|nr:response regulator [Candidatus Wallbacteria bacterium]
MKKILLVDDEIHILNILKFNLAKKGYDVVTAGDGAKALEILAGLIPDLLIIDVMMPKMTGFDVCREMRKDQRLAEVPIVMLSAKSQKEDLARGEEVGVSAYLTKPFSPIALLNKVDELLAVRNDGREK